MLSAVKQSADRSKVYTVNYYKDGVRDSASDMWRFEPEIGDYAGHGPYLELIVTLVSSPPMRPPGLTRAFAISVGGWEEFRLTHEGGQENTPPSIP
jgi:hypothetical protein